MKPPTVILALLLAGCAAPTAERPASAPPLPEAGFLGDAVVVAILDYQGFNPYHLDWGLDAYAAALGLDARPSLPDPASGLPGFPAASTFASYAPLELTLPTGDADESASLFEADEDAWAALPVSAPDEVHWRHVPGTKVLGIVDFELDRSPFMDAGHGARAASAAAGSLYGTCPECLVVLVQVGVNDEAAIEWTLRQAWIDVVTNSYAFTPNTGTPADRTFAYAGCDLDLQREAAERGQVWFWTGSNGAAAGLAPGATLQSCQFGPDWVITVGGIDPRGASQSWAGKPVDVAGPTEGYPTQGGGTVSNATTMGGTSVATPVNAGTLARALLQARVDLAGPSRLQAEGIVARGAGGCGAAWPECELGDGVLTARELRERFLRTAVPTAPGLNAAPAAPERSLPPHPEADLLSEGHGAYWGRFLGDEAWENESRALAATLRGDAPPMERPAGEAEWFIVDSACRQRAWGAWAHGYHQEGQPLPPPNPAWPLRTAYASACTLLPGWPGAGLDAGGPRP